MDSSEQAQKKRSRTHRRVKDEIPTDYICGDKSCGKKYGSNAALYTHIKTKHDGQEPPGTKRPDQPASKGHKGRPKAEQQPVVQPDETTDQVTCKVCMRKQCKCVEKFDMDFIRVLSEENFINLIKHIGGFGASADKTNAAANEWLRDVDADLSSISVDDVRNKFRELHRSDEKHFGKSAVPEKLVKYLSMSSKYWAAETIDELYKGIFIIFCLGNAEDAKHYIKRREDVKIFSKQIDSNPKDYQNLCSVIHELTKDTQSSQS